MQLLVTAVKEFWVHVHCSYRFLIIGQLLGKRSGPFDSWSRLSSFAIVQFIVSFSYYHLDFTHCKLSASHVIGGVHQQSVVGINYEKCQQQQQGEHSTAPVTLVGCTVVASVSSYTPPTPLMYCSASLQHRMLHMESWRI